MENIMPHDRNEKLLEVGDFVMVPCVITHIQPSIEFCNLSLETVEKMYPGENKTTITLNSGQVEKYHK
jgi:hypothetical protein